MYNLSEQSNCGQVVQIGCFRFVVKQALCSDSYTIKHLVRDTLRPEILKIISDSYLRQIRQFNNLY